MAPSLAIGCCGCALAATLVPFAVVLSVLLETPVVQELPASTGAAAAAAEPPPERPAAAPAAAGTAGDAEAASGGSAPRMGSGSMFDRIAFAYDLTNKWMSMGLDQFWRRTLIQDCMRLEKDDRVLDLATGTADVGILAGSRLQELSGGGSVLGVDPSSEMLRRGVAKVETQGLKGVVRLVKGDAQDLASIRDISKEGVLADPTAGVTSGTVDKISIAFGIRNVPNRTRALREMRRALQRRPSSSVCILEFSLPQGSSLLSNIARGFITHVIPTIGRVATSGSGSDEYEYLTKSIMNFPSPLAFAEEMKQAGLPVRSITSFAYGAVQLYAASPAA